MVTLGDALHIEAVKLRMRLDEVLRDFIDRTGCVVEDINIRVVSDTMGVASRSVVVGVRLAEHG